MATKIVTDQPQERRAVADHVVKDVWNAVVEPNFFSVPEAPQIGEVADPDDPENRTLRQGEVFCASLPVLCNRHTQTVRVSMKIARENGFNVYLLEDFPVYAKSTVQAPIGGFSLFRTNLTNLSLSGDRLQVVASVTDVVHMTFSYIEREAVVHDPDTLSIS